MQSYGYFHFFNDIKSNNLGFRTPPLYGLFLTALNRTPISSIVFGNIISISNYNEFPIAGMRLLYLNKKI